MRVSMGLILGLLIGIKRSKSLVDSRKFEKF